MVALGTRVVALVALIVGVVIGSLGPFRAEAAPVFVGVADPKPTACSPDVEDAYEVMRFARYSHSYWISDLDEGEADPYGFSRECHVWWVEHYDLVIAEISAGCDPSPDRPNLIDLPGAWESYPARPSAAPGAG